MFFIISSLIVIFCLILQTSLLTRWPCYGVIPDLSLIVVTCFSMNTNNVRGTTFGFLAGIMQDFISLKSPGASSLCKTCIAFLSGHFRRNKQNPTLLPVLLIIINTLINEGIYLLFYLALSANKSLPSNILIKIYIQILVNLCCAPLFFLIFNRLGRLFTPRESII